MKLDEKLDDMNVVKNTTHEFTSNIESATDVSVELPELVKEEHLDDTKNEENIKSSLSEKLQTESHTQFTYPELTESSTVAIDDTSITSTGKTNTL